MVLQFPHNSDGDETEIEPDEKSSRWERCGLTQYKTPPLWKLCKEGGRYNIPFLEAALGRGEDVNSKDETSNTTALMWAVTHNVCGNAYYSTFGTIIIQNHQHSMARLLLKQPSLDVNCKNNLGETALHCAVEVGNIQGVRLLLADFRLDTFNDENDHGNTPMMTAINKNQIDVLRQLVSHPSIDLETRNWRGWSLEEMARWVLTNQLILCCC